MPQKRRHNQSDGGGAGGGGKGNAKQQDAIHDKKNRRQEDEDKVAQLAAQHWPKASDNKADPALITKIYTDLRAAKFPQHKVCLLLL